MAQIKCPQPGCMTVMIVSDASIDNPESLCVCPVCQQEFCPTSALLAEPEPESLAPESTPSVSRSEPEVAYGACAWLIVHSENTHAQTYPLALGRQVVGRRSSSSPCDIMVDTPDMYMSRRHFCIEVSRTPEGYRYLLSDTKSTNYTYIDTHRLTGYERELKRLAEGEQVELQDGSLIQAGRTKIVLKTSSVASSEAEATRIVLREPIHKTIIV